MSKIKVKKPIVEMDGDEMTRIIWSMIKEKLILPYLDVELKYYRPGRQEPRRDRRPDHHRRGRGDQGARRRRQVRHHHAGRRARHGVQAQEGLALAQRHDPRHPRRHGLPQADHGQQHPARGAELEQADHDRPPRLRRSLQEPGVHRHRPGQGRAGLHARGRPGEARLTIHDFNGPGVVMGMHNTDKSIRSFARACLNYALSEKVDLWFGAKDTISKTYHARFKDVFTEEVAKHQGELDKAGLDLSLPADRRRGGADHEARGRHPLGLQELRRRRLLRHGGRGLRFSSA